MPFSAEVLHTPAIFRSGTGTPRTAIQAGLRDGLDLWVDATRTLQPSSIAAAWQPVAAAPGGLGATAVNTHPGMGPMNDGATWPGPMPNIAAITAYIVAKGIPARFGWKVAKNLQLRGMPAQDWTRKALAEVRPAILALVGQRITAGWGKG